MSLDTTKQLASTISGAINTNEVISQNISPDDPDALFSINISDNLYLADTTEVLEKILHPNSFYWDHPVLGALDSTALVIDAGYAQHSSNLNMEGNFAYNFLNGTWLGTNKDGTQYVTSGSHLAATFNGIDSALTIADTRLNVKSFSVAGQDTGISGIFFKPDGTRFYTTGFTNDRIYQYLCSTPWDITSASYSTFFALGTQTTEPRDVYIKPDGTKFYIVSNNPSDSVYQYTMPTAWELTGSTYDTKVASVTTQVTQPLGLWFKNDGSTMYVSGNKTATNAAIVAQYTLSTSWDISSATYSTESPTLGSTGPSGMWMKDDGTEMWIADSADYLYPYLLTVAHNVSTATYRSTVKPVLYVGGEDTDVHGLSFNSDGTKCYIAGSSADKIQQYTLEYPYDFKNSLFQNGFTIMAWIYPNSIGETNGRIFDKGRSTAGEDGIACGIGTSNRAYLSFGSGSAIYSASNSVPFGSWTHYGATADTSGIITNYINGQVSGTPTSEGRLLSTITNIRSYCIGNVAGNGLTSGQSRTFDGMLDEVMVFNTVLTQTQINDIYTNGFYPNNSLMSNLIIWNKFDNYTPFTKTTTY